MSTMDHVRYLAQTIGPRGSTTAKEEEAARYAAEVMRQAGLQPVIEPFTSAVSAWYPYALLTGTMLVAELLFWFAGGWGAVAALVLGAVVVISVLLELAFRDNPLRWVLPKGRSQNVWARIPASGEERHQVVIMGHLDSHRTPLVFSTDAWLRLFMTLIPVGLASALVLLALFAVRIASTSQVWLWASIPFALVQAAILALTLQADTTPYTAGANDNATGAGVVLSAAQHLAAEPLAHTTVWAVASGCEEVGCYGGDAFGKAHKDEMGDAFWIVLDSVGGNGRPCYLTKETFLLPAHSDPMLLTLAGHVADAHPALGVEPESFSGAYTEGALGAKHGYRVLTLISLPEAGALSEWHRLSDTVENVNTDVLQRTEAFLDALSEEIDRV